MATQLTAPLFITAALLIIDGALSLDPAAIAIGVISAIAATGIQRTPLNEAECKPRSHNQPMS